MKLSLHILISEPQNHTNNVVWAYQTDTETVMINIDLCYFLHMTFQINKFYN